MDKEKLTVLKFSKHKSEDFEKAIKYFEESLEDEIQEEQKDVVEVTLAFLKRSLEISRSGEDWSEEELGIHLLGYVHTLLLYLIAVDERTLKRAEIVKGEKVCSKEMEQRLIGEMLGTEFEVLALYGMLGFLMESFPMVIEERPDEDVPSEGSV